MNRKERVKSVYEFINQHDSSEHYFGDLYAKLLEEFELEMEFNSDIRTNYYLNNLRQTRDKQASAYIAIKAKRPKSGALTEFKDFISNFRHDTIWANR